jgi:hypothetical protein
VTPTATAADHVHDGRIKKISASSSVVLSDGTADIKNIVVQVRNDGTATEAFGVYVDIIPPGGITNPFGCTPTGRIINEVVVLAPGEQITLSVSVLVNCADVPGATGQTFTLVGVIDVHADDAGPCAPSQLMSMTCFEALADDDDDDTDNRVVTQAFRVK